jgi:hypothetical protein
MRTVAVAVAAAGLALLGGIGTQYASGGVLLSDGNAMGSPWQGSVTYNSQLLDVYSAELEYAVYAPGNFEVTFGSVGVDANDYVYAYQFVSVTQGTYNSLDAWIDLFSVGLTDGDEDPQQIGHVSGYGDVDPNTQSFDPSPPATPTQARWFFNDPVLEDGNTSTVMYFSSPFAPEPECDWNNASVSGTQSLGDTQRVPTPTPEPSTLALMTVAGMGVLARRRRRRRGKA